MAKTDLFGKLQLRLLLKNTTKLTGILLKLVAATAVVIYESVKNFIKRSGESFRYRSFTELRRILELPRSSQIRFTPSDTS